ncbi:MAG: 23S rRNA (uracil-5-)-methyltransferase RumA, partial [Deltaproteobacteria bacterium RIFCSPLOWO2_12_FULL_60_19]
MNSTGTLQVKIDSLAYGPYGIARHAGRVVMVPLTVPGDEAEIAVVEEKNNYAVGQLVRLVRPSSQRVEPPCPYVGECGGCPWQMVGYEAQLDAKAKSVEDALRRIGKLSGFELLPILSSPQEYGYRRRIRLQASADKKLGFHRASTHELIEIDSCIIATPVADRSIARARDWAGRLRSTVRHIEIVAGDDGEQVVLVGKLDGSLALEDDTACKRFLESNAAIQGLVLFGRGFRRAWGRGKVRLECEDGLRMELDAEVFMQVNREANRRLANELFQRGEFDNRDRVLELYSGAGNFTLPLARRVGEVVAVEGDSRAVENGRNNGKANGIENIRWVPAHAPNALKQLRRGERFTKIILNPPRSGAKDLEDDLASFGAEKILYVSCNPATTFPATPP